MTKILSPGGNVNMSIMAIEAGADSVYLGPLGWSRRWKDCEMNDDDIKKVNDYAQKKGSTVSLCFNCHCSNDEVEKMYKKIESYRNMGIQSFTLLDFGIMKKIKKMFPDLIIRASIACTIINEDEVAFLDELKVDSVVLQPECFTLEELTTMKKKYKIEQEIIVFGNRDFAHRGRCIMSSYISQGKERSFEGREMFPGSPNKGGLCHRVCLSNWTLSENNKVLFQGHLPNDHYEYYDEIEKYIEVGMDWFKIQGRVYSAGHIAEITNMYRKIIDKYQEFGKSNRFEKWKNDNRSIFENIAQERVNQRNVQTCNRLELNHRVPFV